MAAVLRVEDKYTGEVVQELPLDDREALRARIREAWEWRAAVRRLSLEERRELIRRVGEAVAGHREAFEELLISQAGQPRKFAAWEVERTVTQARAFGALLELVAPRELPARSGRNLLVREPYGVVGVITPRNTPLVVPFYTLFSSLGAGNACVQKPSNLTPGPTVLLVELARKAGWPPGAIQWSTCPGEEAAAEFVENPRVQAFIAYSSSAVGKHNLIKMGNHLERTSARGEYGLPVVAGSMTKYVPELAGNDPFVVLEGADLDLAVTAAVQGGFANAGQLCIAAKRLLVHRPVARAFREALVAALGRLKVGDPRDPETDIGPLGRRTTLEIALRHVARAREQGGTVLCGGRVEE
ncbi:MAG: aldehyde dehydrogenase family protein, partial [Firmicutes bacterium]|nr:aldehyde dehydrogenase family protein [Bacillota bacterium]